MIRHAGELLQRLAQSARWRLWLLFALMLASAAAETVGLLSIIPLVSASLDGANISALAKIALSLEQALLLFLGAMGLRVGLGWWRDRLSASIAARFEADLGARVARALADAPFAEFAARGRGDIQSLLGFDTPRTAAAADQLLAGAVALALLGVAGAAATLLSPLFALVALSAGLLLLSLSIPRWRQSRRDGEAIAALHGAQDEMAQRLVGAIKAAKAQASGPRLASAYRGRLLDMADREQRLLHFQATGRALVLMASAVMAALLVLVGTRLLDMDIVTLGAAILLYARLVQPAQALHRIIDTLVALLPSYARLRPLFETPMAPAPAEPRGWRTLEARNLILSHGAPLFDPVSVIIEPGQWLAITGMSGAGKTSLIDALAGLQQPASGSLTVDATPLRERADWPHHIAYVVQSDLVYHDTVAANLDPERSLDAARLQHVLDIVGLERGLEDEVLELGSGLSGGERQRLLIGRALCRAPSLLLLDEALSALDTEAAAALIARIRLAFPKLAAAIVTHRADIAGQCDLRILLGKERLDS